ncbi:MAG: hypothetical protein R3307_00325 [Anaerolineales bacterium]|nr:hypothetical protein [Anaerolineales bacterium]
MEPENRFRILAIFSLIIVVLSLGYLLLLEKRDAAPLAERLDPTEFPVYSPTNVWASLLDVTPVSYTTPHPALNPSPLDGTYAKFDPGWPQWWSCLRCADYRPAGGAWRLQFDRGVMRIYYEVTGWNSLASYTVSGDRVYLFNDPYCRDETGVYQWELEDGNLTLKTIGDSCSFQLRERNLSGQAWESCDPSDVEQMPRGCEDPSVETLSVLSPSQEFVVKVHQGDVRLFSRPPDVFVNASGADRSLSNDIKISFSDESILYGNNRVLWMDDDWIEIKTDISYSSIGVQFRGDHVIGWARVLFDGEEVWRGDTSRIWFDLKIHGGYIEISGFEAGEHVLRVERLEIDSRPVVVAFFGFNELIGVQK